MAIDHARPPRHTHGTLKTAFLIMAVLLAVALISCSRQKTAAEDSVENKALIQEALADLAARKYDAALAKLQKAAQTPPDDPFVMNLLGAAYTKKKDYQTARDCFEKALAKQPDFFPAKFNVGELLFLQRRYADARDYFKKMQTPDRRNELLQFKIFLCELQLGDKDAAARTMKGIKYPGDTPAWYYAQAAWESKGNNNKKALEYITAAKNVFGVKTALFDETFEDLDIKLR